VPKTLLVKSETCNGSRSQDIFTGLGKNIIWTEMMKL